MARRRVLAKAVIQQFYFSPLIGLQLRDLLQMSGGVEPEIETHGLCLKNYDKDKEYYKTDECQQSEDGGFIYTATLYKAEALHNQGAGRFTYCMQESRSKTEPR